MPFSGIIRRVAVARTDISEERRSLETSVLTRATRGNIPEDDILSSSINAKTIGAHEDPTRIYGFCFSNISIFPHIPIMAEYLTKNRYFINTKQRMSFKYST
jgi:hypothetical protein